MDQQSVKAKLIEVLNEIQSDSGYASTSITGQTLPVSDLEGFDSIIWLDAIGMLANQLNVDIPANCNIFLSQDGKQPLTVDQSSALVYEIVQTGEA